MLCGGPRHADNLAVYRTNARCAAGLESGHHIRHLGLVLQAENDRLANLAFAH